MLSAQLFLTDLDSTLERLGSRGFDVAAGKAVRAAAEARKAAIGEAESLKQEMGAASAAVGQLLKTQQIERATAQREALQTLKTAIKEAEARRLEAEENLRSLLLEVPNLPQADVPIGASEADNREEARIGTPTRFSHTPQAHWDLGPALGIIDFESAQKTSGSRFGFLVGAGAKLERAIAALMLDLASEEGFQEVAPPLLVRPSAMQNSGQYPKFKGESFEVQHDPLVLIPTAEVPLVSRFEGHIFEEQELPARQTAYTPCFRREAGAAGRDTRGLIRNHQFGKVELVSLTHPEKSRKEFEKIVGAAKKVLTTLALPFRVVCLSTGDMGFSAAKTFDLEVFLPGQNAYREISSVSTCEDFQARRANIRFRPQTKSAKGGSKTNFVHTLNGSALATGRTLVAILENYQQPDGSIVLPTALRSYLNAEQINARGDLV